MLPINDIYLPLLTDASRYLLLWGGAGSGKSYFCAQKLLLRLTTEKGHRLLVVRKVANTLRESVWRLLQEAAAGMGIRHEFVLNKTDKTMRHTPTGNELLCVGLNDPEKLKSIAGITGIWIEEATELAENDFDQLDLRLRGETPQYKQILLSFNPVDERHWLKKRFADSPPTESRLVHTTFQDNHFIDEEYKKVLRAKAAANPNYHRIYCLGEWGKAEVERPFMYHFDYSRHVSDRAVFREDVPLRFSLDFNVNPFVCLALHIWKDGQGPHVHFIREFTIPKGDVYKMAEALQRHYPAYVLENAFFTGDAMQRRREITQRDNTDAWRILQKLLRIHDKRLHLPRANPSHVNSRFLSNSLLLNHPDYIFHPSLENTISDMQYVEADENGGIIKSNRGDAMQRADHLDCVRYANEAWLRRE